MVLIENNSIYILGGSKNRSWARGNGYAPQPYASGRRGFQLCSLSRLFQLVISVLVTSLSQLR